MAERLRTIPAWSIAALLAAAYLVIDPPSADLAAQTYRANLFSGHGFLVWDNAWYGGHHMPGYSVLFPPLAALLGPRVVGAVAAIAAAWLFELAAREHFSAAGARAGSLWFAAATAVNLITGRLTFALGVALGLAVVVAATHRKRFLTVLAALATTLASPVAGLFAGLGAAAWFVTTRHRRDAVVLGVAAVAPAVALTVLFSEGGVEPFVASSFWPALLTTAVVFAALPKGERVLRVATALYALATVASYLLDTPMGGNVTRLGGIVGGPMLACVLWPRHARLLALMALPLVYWQWNAPVRDWTRASGDPSVHPGYYKGVARFLDARETAEGPFRVEVPFTANHWESRWLGARVPLARGWERQLDLKYNDVFYSGTLTAGRYRAWLDDAAVAYVALPDVSLDGSAEAEAALLRSGLSYLHPVYSDAHWKVFAVDTPAPMARGGTLTSLGTDSFTLRAQSPGTIGVRVRFTPYWRVTQGSGCVGRDGDWTTVRADHAGPVKVTVDFALSRISATSPRCG